VTSATRHDKQCSVTRATATEQHVTFSRKLRQTWATALGKAFLFTDPHSSVYNAEGEKSDPLPETRQ